MMSVTRSIFKSIRYSNLILAWSTVITLSDPWSSLSWLLESDDVGIAVPALLAEAALRAEGAPQKEGVPQEKRAPQEDYAPQEEGAPQKECATKEQVAPQEECAPQEEGAPQALVPGQPALTLCHG